MDKRRKHIDNELEKGLREDFFAKILSGELTIQESVKRMRRISRLTQTEFAAHRGISLGVLRQLESGKGNPQVETLNRLADIFGLEVGFVKKNAKKSPASSRSTQIAKPQ